MLYLQKRAEEAEAELALPQTELPTDTEVDQMIRDYLIYRQTEASN